MENFVIKIPTTVHFGRDVISKLHKIAPLYGKKALFVTGQGSAFKNGVYDDIVTQLELANIEIIDFKGIKPNPLHTDVDKAANIARQHNVDFIVAAGGGSVIDSAKMISVTAPTNHTVWDFFDNKLKPQKALPLIVVLTVAATGSEMNCFAVIQNNDILRKESYANTLLYPRHSFLDPQYTYTVSAKQTAYGIVDIIAHCLENFFGNGNSPISDSIAIATVCETVNCAYPLLNNLHDYTLRARIMYAATIALNGWNSYGKSGGDWGVHDMGHILSLLFDIPHGASLSIVYPAWLKYHLSIAENKIKQLGIQVFNEYSPEKTVIKFEEFFKSINCPVSLQDAGIGKDKYSLILETMKRNKVNGSAFKLSETDIEGIFKLMAY